MSWHLPTWVPEGRLKTHAPQGFWFCFRTATQSALRCWWSAFHTARDLEIPPCEAYGELVITINTRTETVVRYLG